MPVHHGVRVSRSRLLNRGETDRESKRERGVRKRCVITEIIAAHVYIGR